MEVQPALLHGFQRGKIARRSALVSLATGVDPASGASAASDLLAAVAAASCTAAGAARSSPQSPCTQETAERGTTSELVRVTHTARFA